MYDWLDGDLEDMEYGAYSVKKLRSQEPGMKDDYAAGYAKENGMVIVTADTEAVSGRYYA